ncbi:MAG: acyltransferase domain-containing protein [Deltaproteobacteria bacterium]|nr:acyltransferase domain-containing protein [Deltaproteobacteria bacterium]
MTTEQLIKDSDIAVIGMACRAPGAATLEEFWHNIRDGIESISFFSDEELLAVGIEPSLLNNSDYVKAGGVLSGTEFFDADFFNFSPKEAELTDPQHRIFLECAWESLEHAGYARENNDHVIGIYAGLAMGTYLLSNLLPNGNALADPTSILIGNDKDFLATRVSYKLNLQGPAITVQTACSTSLVAVHLACQSLLNGECDISLAGGVSILFPQKTGYLYQKGSINSPDGHCRAFDVKAMGTVGGNGAGIVVLKLLDQALADGDHIHGVIKGSAINNDGALKVGYTAPGVEGQTQVISEALAMAEIDAESIRYIEAHGTGTTLGDPIEISALTKAFQETTQEKGFCAIGSLKTNIGHTNTAAGVLGLIKTVLALKHGLLPPSLHYEHPNPQIDFENSPFYVNTGLSKWDTNGIPRRAGVSSFGIGGTNAHVVLEQAPKPLPNHTLESVQPCWLLVLSAETPSALDKTTDNLADYLTRNPNADLKNAAYTLNCRRRHFKYRRVLICQSISGAVTALETLDPERVITGSQLGEKKSVVFMFPGQGVQYFNMGHELYRADPVFQKEINTCSNYLESILELDLRRIIFQNPEQESGATQQINQTIITQTALFTVEYSLAKMWINYGIHPRAMIGHSIGEYVAACLAGVFSLEDALSLVAARGQLMQFQPRGAMLAVMLPESKLVSLLPRDLCMAAVNTPGSCVVSGTGKAVNAFQDQLTRQGVASRRVKTSHGFHSRMMAPLLSEFTDRVRQVKLNSPKIPYISNVTGDWITDAQATDPAYWAEHLRQTVRFSDGLQRIMEDKPGILLEVGPGKTLSTFAKQHSNFPPASRILTSLCSPKEKQSDTAFVLRTLGWLWLDGESVDWPRIYANENCVNLPLPTYPFERRRYWIEAPGNHKPARPEPVKISSQPAEPRPGHFRSDSLKTFVAPRNQLKQTIAEIWSDALGIEQIGIHDDFFGLGGDSLLAIQILARLSRTLKIELDSHTLLNNATIIALAKFIEENAKVSNTASQQSLPSCLVPIQRKNSLTQPLFLMHPVGGHVYFYREMAESLGSEQPVYGLQAQGVDGKTAPHSRVEDMATHYIEAIRMFQPKGPYFLGGSSFGGTLAFEMAQQLQTLGQEVAFLAMMDTPGPGHMPVEFDDDAQILAYMLDLGENIPVSISDLRKLSLEEQIDYCIEKIKMAKKEIPDIDRHWFRTVLKLFKANSKAMINYTPKPYAGEILFFRARERDAYLPDNPERAWIDMAQKGIHVHIVPGNHISMNASPQVRILGKQLKICLDQARAAMTG